MSKRREPAMSEMPLPGMIDSHFHSVMMKKRELDPEGLIADAVEAGLAGGIDIGVEAGDTAGRVWIRDRFPGFLLASGLAPAEAERENIEDRLELLVNDLKEHPIEAIGEIGVDGYWNYGTPDTQRELFAAQIEIANRWGLPVIIHSRASDELLLEVLDAHRPEHGGIMHCYSSGYDTAVRCIDHGLLISFAGNITFKKSDELREVARSIPEEAILAETDSPFLSPEPLRGKPNHPGRVGFVYSSIAECRGLETADSVETIGENYRRLFGNTSSR